MTLAPAMCSGCGVALSVDPRAEVVCGDCGSPVYLVSVEDLAPAVDDVVDVEAADLEALVEGEELLGEVLAVFDHAGLSGLSEAVELLDGETARECLFVAVVQLAETGALHELAGMN